MPPAVYDLFVATSARTPHYFKVLTEHLSELLCLEVEGAAAHQADGEKEIAIHKTLRRSPAYRAR